MENLISTRNKDNPLGELQTYVYWIAFSLLPVTALYIYGALASGSLSVAALTFQSAISIFANLFTVISIRSIVNKNIFIFPYGTGKLENFIGFLTGTLMLPIAGMIYVSTANSFMNETHVVRFGYTQIALIPSLVRDISLLVWSKRLIEKSRSPSPIIQAFYVSYKVTVMVTIISTLSMFCALWLTSIGHGQIGSMIDLTLAAVLSTYMVVSAAILIKVNFRSLIDLPLAEGDQLKIMNALSRYYNSFDNLGVIYTRMCGSTKIVEIELYFKPQTPLEEIDSLAENLRAQLSGAFVDLSFRLIPIIKPNRGQGAFDAENTAARTRGGPGRGPAD